jgi:uncharacterized NAD-dependent epimerase/dehydratase family protein
MLHRDRKLALYMADALADPSGKMGFGLLRYSPNPVACVIDPAHAGRNVQEVIDTPRSCPVVASVEEAVALGSEVFVLGIAPAGGLIPQSWWADIERAVDLGMSVVNGLHDLIGPRFAHLRADQFIWDVRLEPPGLGVGTAAARELGNKRVLMIGTDMAVGKMTSGLEIYRSAVAHGIRAEFVATGQIGITIIGSGVPLDAVRVDFASGAIEREVLRTGDADLVVVEGQGALIHPGSTSTLPLLRGCCPTHLVLCCRARQETLRRVPWVRIPPLRDYARLYEDLAEALGTFPRPETAAICMDTSALNDEDAHDEIEKASVETGLPCTDPVRLGVEPVLKSLGLVP